MVQVIPLDVDTVPKHCLWCKKYYTPSYPSKDEAKASGNLMAIEQWISGMCSDSCWNELFDKKENA